MATRRITHTTFFFNKAHEFPPSEKKGGGMPQYADIIIELQPVLSRVEADRVLRVIADLLAQRHGEKLTGTGTDFSGRHWFRGRAGRQSIRGIAKDFYSVQSIHAPLFSIAAACKGPCHATIR